MRQTGGHVAGIRERDVEEQDAELRRSEGADHGAAASAQRETALDGRPVERQDLASAGGVDRRDPRQLDRQRGRVAELEFVDEMRLSVRALDDTGGIQDIHQQRRQDRNLRPGRFLPQDSGPCGTEDHPRKGQCGCRKPTPENPQP
jgi:hypothetical protein